MKSTKQVLEGPSEDQSKQCQLWTRSRREILESRCNQSALILTLSVHQNCLSLTFSK